MRYMVTGPREWDWSQWDEFNAGFQRYFARRKGSTILCGGAQGFDIACAMAAHNAGIQTQFVLPNPGYIQYYFSGKGFDPKCLGRRETIDRLIEASQNEVRYAAKTIYVGTVHSNYVRNELLVSSSDAAIVGLTDGKVPMSGGTGHAVRLLADTKHTIVDDKFVIRRSKARSKAGVKPALTVVE